MTDATCLARILVVDDEGVVAQTLAFIFLKAGYEARSVLCAERALELLEAGWVPQLAIIDVHLPGMNGIDLAITLKARQPEVNVCLFSGRTATADLLDAARQQGYDFEVLAKPVHPTVFLGMASDGLDHTGRNMDVLH